MFPRPLVLASGIIFWSLALGNAQSTGLPLAQNLISVLPSHRPQQALALDPRLDCYLKPQLVASLFLAKLVLPCQLEVKSRVS